MPQSFPLQVRVPLPPPDVFDLFATEYGLTSWLCPAAHVEPSVGGAYELFWRPDDRERDSTLGCRLTAYAPDSLLAFDWKSPVVFAPFANAADPLTHVVVSFSLDGPGTAVHLVHSGWRAAAPWREARAWQERAWRGALAQLGDVAP